MTPLAWLVVVLQAMGQTAAVIPVAISSVLALALSGEMSWSTLPSSSTMLANTLMIALLPTAVKALGYRGSFVLGNLLLVLAGVLGYIALQLHHFWLFVLAHVCIGFASSFSQQYRFVAADLATNANTAITWVMSTGVVAALVGPWVVTHTQQPQPMYSYSYVAIAALGLLAALSTLALRMESKPNNVRKLVRFADVLPALSLSAVGYTVMVLMMTATPLIMDICGLRSSTPEVIRWHLMGMFAPSLIVGRLRLSTQQAVWAGLILMVAQAIMALSGRSYWHFLLSLLLLGVGWNLMFLSSTRVLSKLTSTWDVASQSGARSMHDFALFVMVSIASVSAGPLLKTIHWEGMALLTLVPVLALAVYLWLKPNFVNNA